MSALISEILARYGAVDAFCNYIHGLLDVPTEQLPAPMLVALT
ncbi:hypothetical protein [Nocardia sp. CA-119907]